MLVYGNRRIPENGDCGHMTSSYTIKSLLLAGIVALNVLLASFESADAGIIDLLAESDVDTVGGSEIFHRSYNSLNDFTNGVIGPGGWSQINVGAGFSVVGMTWIGEQLYLLAESDTDAGSGAELFLRAYNSLSDFYTNTTGPGGWSQVDVGAGFSVVGMTWDGLDLYLIAESDIDSVGGSEVFLRSYDTVADFVDGIVGPGDWSQVDVGTGFSIAGMTWDSLDLLLLAESDTDAGAGSELFWRSYDTFADLLANNTGPGAWSQVDVGIGFSVHGMATRFEQVPEPTVLMFFALGLAGLGFANSRRARKKT